MRISRYLWVVEFESNKDRGSKTRALIAVNENNLAEIASPIGGSYTILSGPRQLNPDWDIEVPD